MKERKMVFFDVDGTLIESWAKGIPESTVRAIHRLRENGHLAFVCSGRTWVNINEQIQAIGFDGYICGCGTRIYLCGQPEDGTKHCGAEMGMQVADNAEPCSAGVEKTPVFSKGISPKKCAQLVKKLREFGITAFFEGENVLFTDVVYHPVKNPGLVQARENFIRAGLKLLDFPENPEGDEYVFDKFFCLLTKEGDVEGLKAYLGDEFSATPQGEGCLEVVPAGCTKGEGIRLLQKKFGIGPEDCFAAGDSENDIPMFEAVSNRIAMGDCAPELLRRCTYHTAKVSEDGIWKAMEHYGLV